MSFFVNKPDIQQAGNSLNTVERQPVPTRVLDPDASKASYRPKQRIYRKTNLKNKVLVPDSPGAQTAAPKRTRPVGVPCFELEYHVYTDL